MSNPDFPRSGLRDLANGWQTLTDPFGLLRSDNEIAERNGSAFSMGEGARGLAGGAHLFRNKEGEIIGGSANLNLNAVSVLANSFPGLPLLLDAVGANPDQISKTLSDYGVTTQTSVNVGAGRFQDSEGKTQRGLSLNASSAKASREPLKGNAPTDSTLQKLLRAPISGDISGPDAAGGFSDDGSTLSATLQANAASASLTAGDAPNPEGNVEHTRRIGLSKGEGFAGRLHHGDADGDGLREWGAGFDFGPVSADIKTEDPLGMLLKSMAPLQYAAMTRSGHPGEELLSMAAGGTRTLPNGRTLTEISGINELADDVLGPPVLAPGVIRRPRASDEGSLYRSGKKLFGAVSEGVSEFASNPWEYAKRRPGDLYQASGGDGR
jgi:hypothetical protein